MDEAGLVVGPRVCLVRGTSDGRFALEADRAFPGLVGHDWSSIADHVFLPVQAAARPWQNGEQLWLNSVCWSRACRAPVVRTPPAVDGLLPPTSYGKVSSRSSASTQGSCREGMFMEQKTTEFQFTNNDDPITLIIEPWAEEFQIPTGSTVVMKIKYRVLDNIETELTPKYFVVWLWCGCQVEVLIDGVDKTTPFLSTPAPG